MSYCCVPLCKSDEKKKPPGVSFHEIPSVADVREKWLAAIRRDNWSPNSTSCYTKVCSRHFRADDFLEGKRRRLKKGAVPTVFEDYPQHLQPRVTSERSTASIAKRARAPLRPRGNATSTAASGLLSPVVSAPQVHTFEEPGPMDLASHGPHQPEPMDLTKSLYIPHDIPPTCDRGVQMDDKQVSSLLAAQKAKWKGKERRLRKQVLRLQQALKKYKSELRKLQQDSMADTSHIK